MLNNKNFLAIIPARGGSKRLPRKNVLDLAGKPLIAWTIEAGKNSSYIDKVVVTSDDEEIMQIASNLGADVIERPAELASDTATTFDAIKHAIENTSGHFDYVVVLQPTSPLRNSMHVDEAIELLFEKQADAIISICETEHSPLWSNTLPEDGSLKNFLPDEIKNKRSQDLPKYYRLNGAIYLCKVNRLLSEKSLFLSDRINGYVMSIKNSIDIDVDTDFELAKILIQS
jgi:CMP-N,N'-diacetyllegionaminic acid synthase